MATPRVGAAPIDFKDDPFKNYRYEDPFNIKDPFEDEEETPADPEQIFKNDISSTFGMLEICSIVEFTLID